MSKQSSGDPWLINAYLLNFSLVVAHEIDSAYWQEWEMFRLPGGVQFFVALHLGLILLFLIGFRQVVLGEQGHLVFSGLLAATGVMAFVIHAWFLMLGYEQFRLPISLTLLAVTLMVSLVQGNHVLQALRKSKTVET